MSSGVFYGSYNPDWGSHDAYNASLRGITYSCDGEERKKITEEYSKKLKKKTKECKEESSKKAYSCFDPEEKFNRPSLIDPNVKVDNKLYGVSLLSSGGEWHGHAMILIDGNDENNQPFCIFTDFTQRDKKGSGHLVDGTSKGKVKLTRYPGPNPCYPKKGEPYLTMEDVGKKIKDDVHANSKHWLVPAEKVNRMIRKIEREMSGEDPVYFSILAHTKMSSEVDGEDFESVKDSPYFKKPDDEVPHQWNFTGKKGNFKGKFVPDNCISWAARKLQMLDIIIPIKVDEYVPTLPKYSTNNFTKDNQKEADPLRSRRPFKKEYEKLPETTKVRPVVKDYYIKPKKETDCPCLDTCQII